MRARPLLGLLVLAGLALPACYETPTPACAFLCGQGGACPDGYTCRADSWCRREDVPDDAVCAVPSDAATPEADAPPADAAPDGAPADAALFDAAAPDAALFDAATLDAAPPDASPPDASPPDAAPIDAATLAGG